MDPLWERIGMFGGWVIALVGGLFALLPKKGALENQRIDQFQEDLKEQRIALGEQTDRIDKLEGMLIWYQRRDIAWERYVVQIQNGVERDEMPPWPTREGILTEEHP